MSLSIPPFRRPVEHSIMVCERVPPLLALGVSSLLAGSLLHPFNETQVTRCSDRSIGDLRLPVFGVDLAIQSGRSVQARLLYGTCPHCAGARVLFLAEGWLETERVARSAGLAGYLGPYASPDDLRAALKAILDGGFAYRSGASPRIPIGKLTRRQLQILELAGRGLTDGEIGDALSIAEATVRHHIEALQGKLAARRRADLGAAAALGGFLPSR
jgi:DNA-binding NarL/FixJ family response regulator